MSRGENGRPLPSEKAVRTLPGRYCPRGKPPASRPKSAVVRRRDSDSAREVSAHIYMLHLACSYRHPLHCHPPASPLRMTNHHPSPDVIGACSQ
eukprot:4107907-Pyramimonas_sp.AAC.1